MAPISLPIRYITHDEYTDSRNDQDQRTAREISAVQANIDRVRDDLGADIKETEDRLRGEIKQTENSLRGEIKQTENSLRGEIKQTENKLRAEIKQTEDRLRAEIKETKDELRAEIKQTEDRLRAEIKETKDELRAEIKETKDELLAKINAVSDDLQNFKAEMREFKVQTTQTLASIRNGMARNPALPVQPVPRWNSKTQESLYPELFPRSAKEFYSLRNPTSKASIRMLIYLARFYDLKISWADSPGEESNEDEDFVDNPEWTVGLLENILGLDEQRFIEFQQRAQHFNTELAFPVRKRRSRDEGGQKRQRQKMDIWAMESDESIPKAESEFTRLLWGSRSTPSSQRRTVNDLKSQPKAQSEPPRAQPISSPSSGSPTNEYSTPLRFKAEAGTSD